MTEPPNTLPTRQAIEAKDRSAPRRVTGRVKAALDAMVWEGLPRKDAADKAGLRERSLYKALRRPPVKAYYLEQCEVLRVSGRARRILRLEELAAQNTNMNAAVQAIRAAELIGDDPEAVGRRAVTPGLVLIIGSGPAPAPAIIDVSPSPADDDRP